MRIKTTLPFCATKRESCFYGDLLTKQVSIMRVGTETIIKTKIFGINCSAYNYSIVRYSYKCYDYSKLTEYMRGACTCTVSMQNELN